MMNRDKMFALVSFLKLVKTQSQFMNTYTAGRDLESLSATEIEVLCAGIKQVRDSATVTINRLRGQ